VAAAAAGAAAGGGGGGGGPGGGGGGAGGGGTGGTCTAGALIGWIVMMKNRCRQSLALLVALTSPAVDGPRGSGGHMKNVLPQ